MNNLLRAQPQKEKVNFMATGMEDPKDKVVVAARSLVKKLELVHKDPRYQAVWSLWQGHCSGKSYSGPMYDGELKVLVEALHNLGLKEYIESLNKLDVKE